MRATTIAATGLLAGLALLASSCGDASPKAVTAAGATTATQTTASTTTGTGLTSSATVGNPAPFAKFAACMKAHGATVGRFLGGPRTGQLPPGGQPPAGQRPPTVQTRNSTPAQEKKVRAALAACRKLAPQGAGGFGTRPGGQSTPQFEQYRACMKKHGVTLPRPGSAQLGSAQPGGTATADSKAFRAATQACGPLLARPATGNP